MKRFHKRSLPVLLSVLGTLLPFPAQAQTAATGTVRGVVVDRNDGRPVADVAVQIQDAKRSAKTNAEGKFELTGVEAGTRVLYVSFVGFALVKRPVDVPVGGTVDVTIALTEGTGTYSETVTVTAGERFREVEPAVPAQQTLGSADIQNLRNLLTNDPMRAIQVLPGVTTGDDLRSEFAVRGNGFDRMNFTFDGVQTTFLLHKVQQAGDGGSVAMLNGDILDGITLLNGSYPQRFGNRVGAELDFHMREGSRDRTQARLGVSGTDASLVLEGPLGTRKAGSWLVSGRKSYLEYILKKLRDEDDDFGFGFSDVQAKGVYDVSPRHHVELSAVAGRSRLDQSSTPDEINNITDGRSRALLVTGAWRLTASPRLIITERLSAGFLRFTNANENRDLGHGTGRELTWRTDVMAVLPKDLMLELGAQVQAQRSEEAELVYNSASPAGRVVSEHSGNGTLSSAFGQLRWTPRARFNATAGARVDYWSFTRETTGSPWAQAEFRLSGSLAVRGGAGVYRQVANLAQVTGTFAPPTPIRAERAVQTDIGIEQRIGTNVRWQATFYNRDERNVPRLPNSEFRVDNGRLVFPTASAWTDTLRGHARGIELLVQRRSNTGLAGTVSYSYGATRYRDEATGETFDGDYDQRHTFNAYGLYRLTDRLSFSGKLRVGSNTPALGYWTERNGLHFVGDTRNSLRLPAYARLDLRMSRTFHWSGKRLSLFAEVMNVMGRDNLRYEPPGINTRTFQAFGLTGSMIPRIPSLGILIEF